MRAVRPAILTDCDSLNHVRHRARLPVEPPTADRNTSCGGYEKIREYRKDLVLLSRRQLPTGGMAFSLREHNLTLRELKKEGRKARKLGKVPTPNLRIPGFTVPYRLPGTTRREFSPAQLSRK